MNERAIPLVSPRSHYGALAEGAACVPVDRSNSHPNAILKESILIQPGCHSVLGRDSVPSISSMMLALEVVRA